MPAVPSLEELARHPAVVLKDEGPGVPRVVRYDLPQGPVVLKYWDPQGSWLLRWWARLLMRREIRNYRLLQGCPAVPAYLGHYGHEGLLLQFVPGVPLKRQLGRERLERVLGRLEESLAALHGRRFAHLDLHQKLNALVGPDDRVWFVDLGQGVDCSGGPRRLLFPLLAWVDRGALVKFRARYAPQTLPESSRARLEERHRGTRWRRWKALRRAVRRHLAGGPR